MTQIQAMCQRVAWINHGKIQKLGEPEEVIEAYRAESS